MEFDNEINYYINFQNEQTEFENLEDIEDENNIKSINYRGYDRNILDFSIFKNLVSLYIVLPYAKNIILKNLPNLQNLYINGSLIDADDDTRKDNKILEEIDISGCPNIVLLTVIYMRNLKNIKHDLLKKLCKFYIFMGPYSEYNPEFINKYNKENIERYYKNVDKDLICLSRRRIFLLYENKEEKTICTRCGRYVKDINLLNVRDTPFLYNFITYTCC